jgi:peptide/nickel transport system permease protein
VTPSFVVALFAVLIFAVYIGGLPSIGYTPPQEDFWQFLKHIILPASVMGIDLGASTLRYLRTDFLEQMKQDYVRTARAKGIPERVVFGKHVLKNSLISFVTVLGFDIQRLLGGSTIIETMFAYPGISFLMFQSILSRDFAIVQGVVLFIAIIVIAVNLLVDFIYSVLDPRVRYA